jgi:hypothetical protein
MFSTIVMESATEHREYHSLLPVVPIRTETLSRYRLSHTPDSKRQWKAVIPQTPLASGGAPRVNRSYRGFTISSGVEQE